MEPEFKERRRPARLLMLIGVVLAVVAGGGAFIFMSQASKDVAEAQVPLTTVVVAARPIPARKVIEKADITTQEIALYSGTVQNILTDPTTVVGRVAAISIFAGQPISSNLFATAAGNGTIAVLNGDEIITAKSPAWRAVSLNVPPDRALGGLLEAGQTIDIFVTVPISVNVILSEEGKYVADRSTKIAYQDVSIIAKAENFYIVRVTQKIAEEIAHLQASGSPSERT
jgi:Flp pilus assembly protein CpaB